MYNFYKYSSDAKSKTAIRKVGVVTFATNAKSVLEKAGYVPEFKNIDVSNLSDESSFNTVKIISNFADTLKQVVDKNEPSILSRYLIELSQSFSSFYNNNKIIGEQKEKQDARLYLTYVVGNIIKTGANLLGIEMPDRM